MQLFMLRQRQVEHMLRVTNLKLTPEEAATPEQERRALQQKLSRRWRLQPQHIRQLHLVKKSLDARRKPELYLVYTVDVELEPYREQQIQRRSLPGVQTVEPAMDQWELPAGIPNARADRLPLRPVIVGMGPAGMFAGLLLARCGYRPLILERGASVEARTRAVDRFWRQGILDEQSNVQFGEGGAGTFSDGKLTTRIEDPRCRLVLQTFVQAGAPAEIMYRSKPHIGTDILRTAVRNIREEIKKYGGEIRFQARVSDFIIEKQRLQAVVVNERDTVPTHLVLLGIGHSARDTFALLAARGVRMYPKPFSLGVRVEHWQTAVNQAQYGQPENVPGWGPADYALVYHARNGRSAYSFCMCPGGVVVAAASGPGEAVTNGMSFAARSGRNANAAVLVGVKPPDFGDPDDPLAGVAFQKHWEQSAYTLGGGQYRAPVQLLDDFMQDQSSSGPGGILPTYRPGVNWNRLSRCLPDYVAETLQAAFKHFAAKIPGFDQGDAVLTGVESRSSSPLRIGRDDAGVANIEGLYPIGEGAGYAGGIMSSAVDGLKAAEKVMASYAPPSLNG